jgi:hypothetical protein
MVVISAPLVRTLFYLFTLVATNNSRYAGTEKAFQQRNIKTSIALEHLEKRFTVEECDATEESQRIS